MEAKVILPILDTEALQKKANDYAQKGAEKALEDFYTGYDSPYKKALIENLQNKGIDANFNIPDIIGMLNDRLTQEIDIIANTAISKTFIPLVKEFLTREESEIKFSQILEKFIEHSEFKYDDDLDMDDYTVEKIEDTGKSYRSSFFQYQISNGKIGYELRFYKNGEGTTIMSLPYMLSENGKYYRNYESKQTMKISLDGGASLELPFTKGILEDSFVSFIARLVIGNSKIIFDVTEFDEDMFPKDECNC